MQTAQGSLVVIGAHTADPHVFWNGVPVLGVISLRIDNEPDEQRVRLRVRRWQTDAELLVYGEMRIAGIYVKEDRT